jgi:16S rRNA pseudouridine516 synthase
MVTVGGETVDRRQRSLDVQPRACSFTVQGKAVGVPRAGLSHAAQARGLRSARKSPAPTPASTPCYRRHCASGGGGAAAGVQAVGRLDQDTTGLLLLSDDGKFIHRMSSPKHHVPKVYQVLAKHPVDDKQVQKLLSGVVLDDDPKPVKAAACEKTGDNTLSLTLTEGKYHQVKRMIAAVGNRVEEVGGLHRSRIGELALPEDLKPGGWRWLTAQDLLDIAGKKA